MIRSQVYSFKNAFSGLFYVLRTQPNMRVHLFLSLVALIAGHILNLSYAEFLVILTLIVVGLALEIVNTAIEITIDSIHTTWHEKAKLAKDVSSAAMLLFAIGTLVISCILFIPKIVGLL